MCVHSSAPRRRAPEPHGAKPPLSCRLGPRRAAKQKHKVAFATGNGIKDFLAHTTALKEAKKSEDTGVVQSRVPKPVQAARDAVG